MSQQSDVTITGLTHDSRLVKEGFLFAALRGDQADGTVYIQQAIDAGAVAILTHSGVKVPEGVVAMIDENPRRVMGHIAALYYGKQPGHVAAVTGTNGKTSVVHFCRQLWKHLGVKGASIGTLGVMDDHHEDPSEEGVLTTPDSITLQKVLSALVTEEQVDYAALEASSHGLVQERLTGTNVAVAAFTNISRDHLDYHATFEEYFEAKKRIFSELLPEGGVAVLNADIPQYDELVELCLSRGHRVVGYGKNAKNIRLREVEAKPDGLSMIVEAYDQVETIHLPLIGAFQAENVLCAMAMVMSTGFLPSDVLREAQHLVSVPGRMELVAGEGVVGVVDYAHTPDALENALKALRLHTDGKLHLVFGCGGDRDTGKRALMGEVAAQHADDIVITDDNPRSEDPAAIRQAILKACPAAIDIAGREEAIRHAVAQMAPGDMLLVAGKGHEHYQIVGDETLPFDDVAVLKAALGV